MDRPTGVTALVVLDFLGALFCVLGGLFFANLGEAGADVWTGRAGTEATGFLMDMRALGVAASLAAAVVFVIMGIGLWKLWNWARVVTIVIAALGLLFSAFGILTGLLHFRLVPFMFRWLVFVPVYVWILWYMFQPHVKQAFSPNEWGEE